MKKTIFTLLAITVTSTFAIAQSVADGIKFLYYEKNKSARETLEKVVASNSKDASAIYWLGQAYLADRKNNEAKALYQKALNDGVNEPWIWIGMGHVELLQDTGNVASARQRFEQAITSTKGKKGENPDILNAIVRANADGSSKQGDPQYGIELGKKAQQLDTKNPDIDINLGVCYLKLGTEHGGEAVEAFRDATVRNPQYARGYFMMGRVYQAQNNKESMDEQYAKAINADPAYAPVYLAYFQYYSERDVNAAKEYLDKYVANADQDCRTDYFVADYLFRAGKYQESLNKAKEMESGTCKDFPRVNVLYAYNYDRLGDSMQARSYIEKFFANYKEDVEPTDYAFAGNVYAKFPGNEDSAAVYLSRAIEFDTVKANRIEYMNTAVNILGKAGKIQQQLEWLNKRSVLEGGDTLSEGDYYKIGTAAINAISVADSIGRAANDTTQGMKAYALADSIATAYITTYPDKPQGYSIRVLAAKKADRDTTLGLAVEPINQQNQFLMKDTAATAKKTIFANDYYLLLYYTQYATDAPKVDQYKRAIDVLDQMLQLYPDAGEEHDFAMQTKQALENSLKKFQQQKSNPPKSKTKG